MMGGHIDQALLVGVADLHLINLPKIGKYFTNNSDPLPAGAGLAEAVLIFFITLITGITNILPSFLGITKYRVTGLTKQLQVFLL